VKATIWRPRDLGPAELEHWHGLQAAAGLDSPFLAPEFVQAAAEAFPSTRVAVVHDGPDLVGFLPFSAHRFRTASVVGGSFSNLQAFISTAGDWTLEDVAAAARLASFDFSHLVASQRPLTGTTRPADLLVIDLTEGFDHYLEGARKRGGKLVKGMDQKRRSLERNDPDLRFEFAGHDVAALRTLCEWKSAQLRRTGRQDPFEDPAAWELLERAAGSRSAAMVGSVSCLRSGDRLLAAVFDLRSATVQSGWLSAYDVEAASSSPGIVCLLHVIEAAARSGVRSFELGPGGEPYKQRLATGTLAAVDGWVGHPTVGRRVVRRLRRASHRRAA
jgi:CelD/BcsL family acetyltransferase involved in cellulose biosynthesis